jgi:cell division protein ZapE
VSDRDVKNPRWRLTDRHPHTAVEDLIGGLVPPPHFADASFDSYIPDAGQPSQQAAVATLKAFGERLRRPEAKKRLFRRAAPPESRAGIYLDGGFGVGKTHLLVSLWLDAPSPKAYGTFVEFTNLVGAMGFASAVESLSRHRLICIDEFELDDPGDTVLMSTLLNRLVENGVALAATSNTLPDRLGEGRFAADDFLREIQGLSAHFDILRIEGEDYRHRGLPQSPQPMTEEELLASYERLPESTYDTFSQVQAHLSHVHPSRYGGLVEGLEAVHVADVRTLTDQVQALRTVVLIDRLYDRDIPVYTSGVPLERLFSEEMLRGGYRKKYQRALSRVIALARASDDADPAS